jgi:hypothetical protein
LAIHTTSSLQNSSNMPFQSKNKRQQIQRIQQARAQQIRYTAISRRQQVDENAHQDIEIGLDDMQGYSRSLCGLLSVY